MTGEHISALEGIGVMSCEATSCGPEGTRETAYGPRFASEPDAGRERGCSSLAKESEARTRERGKAAAMELGL